MSDETVPMGDGVECAKCSAVFDEVLNTFRISLDRMKDIAAKGKGQDAESDTNPLYNRYMGCALAMDTLMNEYFPERVKALTANNAPEVVEKEETEEESAEVKDTVVVN